MARRLVLFVCVVFTALLPGMAQAKGGAERAERDILAGHGVQLPSGTRYGSSEGCAATPVHTTPFPRRDLGGIPWLAATPASSGITAHLFYRRPAARGAAAELHTGGKMPNGDNTKILWVVDNPKANVLGPLTIYGSNLTGQGTMRQVVPRALSATDFPSILTIPAPGCWLLELVSKSETATGATVAGAVVIRAVK